MMPLNGPRSLTNFTIDTFNVRGLSSATKRGQLSEDLNKLHIDVCCIQETKCPSGFDVISGYYRLIGLPSTSRHYGLAFAVASNLSGRRPLRTQFRDAVSESLPEVNPNMSASQKWGLLKGTLKSASETTIGRTEPRQKNTHCQDMAAMSDTQRNTWLGGNPGLLGYSSTLIYTTK